ncbi:MAG: glycosyl hydrolase-related protein [Terriglobia bacterium]|jgi:hypothetical protein
MRTPAFIAAITKHLWLTASLFLLVSAGSANSLAAENLIWRLGQRDLSDHEFTTWPNPEKHEPVVVEVGQGNEEKLWPKFHPGSANQEMGAHAYSYTLVFGLPSSPRGLYYLEVDGLFRHPRVPILRVEINGHQGDFYFSPQVSWALGDESDAFNPIHAEQAKRIAIPARFLRAGENRLTLTCLDEPATVTRHITAGGAGDSGFYYDALKFTQDAEGASVSQPEARLEPTIFFRKAAAGLEEETWLTVEYPPGWQAAKVRIGRGGFSTETEITKRGEFGEARVPVYIPDSVAAGEARIEFTNSWTKEARGLARQSFTTDFKPQRKWKVFYAPEEHLDVGFTDYQAKVAEVQARVLDQLPEVLAAHPDYRFNIDGSWVVQQWLGTRTAEEATRFAAAARAGKIGVNGFYANLMTELPASEELFRALYFSKHLEDRYGVPLEAAWATDVPSYGWAVPSALAAAGIRYFAGGGNQTRGPLQTTGHWNARSPFWWEGPDGQRVLAWFSYHYHQLRATFGVPPSLEAGASALPIFLQPYERDDYAPDAVLLYGTEVENLPLDFLDADLAAQWNARYAYPQIVPCRFAEYFRYVEQHYGGQLPVVRGDGGGYWEDGAGTDAAATSVYRQDQTRAVAAEALVALNTGINRALAFPLEVSRRIWSNIVLYGEHTFVSYRGVSQPQHDEVTAQLAVKEGRATRAAADIDELLRRGLSQLADQIQTEGEDLIVFNALSWKRSGLVRFQVDAGTALTDVATGQPVPYEVVEARDRYATIRFWAREVPPLGYKVFRLGRGPAVEPGRSEPESNIIQNKFYRLTFDPTRAALKSLYDKELGRELIDPASPYLAAEYLYVTGGGTEKGRGEDSEATQLTHLARSLPFAELKINHPSDGQLVAVEKTCWGHVVKMTAQALNTPKVETEVYLPDEEKRIEIRSTIHKQLTYAKEAAYFAFPWAAANPTFRYEIANGWVDPEKDLMAGASVEWSAVQDAVSVEDGANSVTLAVVDAPLVSLADINRGRWPERFRKSSASVFSYALNNYWFTNTPAGQSGDMVFRYAVTSGGRFDPVQAARFGREARTPLEVSELRGSDKLEGAKGKLPAGTASLGSVEPENLVINALKGAEDGQGLIVRVYEAGGKAADGTLTLPWVNIASASQANAVEVNGKPLDADAHSVRFHIEPHRVMTIRVATQ